MNWPTKAAPDLTCHFRAKYAPTHGCTFKEVVQCVVFVLIPPQEPKKRLVFEVIHTRRPHPALPLRDCRRSFSDQTRALTVRERKPHVDQPLYRLLNSGVSQRRCAMILGISRTTVARKARAPGPRRTREAPEMARLGRRRDCESVVIDEMETLEHTKMKPLAIAVAVSTANVDPKGRSESHARQGTARRTHRAPSTAAAGRAGSRLAESVAAVMHAQTP